MAVEKTVFISYRAEELILARTIFQDLRATGYDAFLDYESIPADSIEPVILNQIKARAHFLVILTPSTLEPCVKPDDQLRREIETALDHNRNIIPVMLEGWDFEYLDEYLVDKLKLLKGYNGLLISYPYFDSVMDRLRSHFLDVSVDVVLSPTPVNELPLVQQAIAKEDAVPKITAERLATSEFFGRGIHAFQAGDKDAAIRYFTEILDLDPRHTIAYLMRGHAYHDQRDYDRAIVDYSQVLELDPRKTDIFSVRAVTYYLKGDYDRAFADFDQTILLNPQNPDHYFTRGFYYAYKGDLVKANADYQRYIDLGGKDVNTALQSIRTNEEKLRGQ